MVHPFPEETFLGETTIRDWSMFTGVSPQAHFLFRVVSCLSPHNPKGSDEEYVKISDERLCELLGRMIDKIPSLRTLARWRDELVAADLIRVTRLWDQNSPGDPRIYHVRRVPPSGWGGPLNIHEALSGVRTSSGEGAR